ncbi:MAG: pyridoxal 5'-phosphate synthase glutaminase subunit PdxT [Prevotella sp.]
MTIAVLALQGAFIEHEQMLRTIGVDSFEVRQLSDWQKPKDGLIIPGGESTTQLKLLRDLNLLEPIREYIIGGGAVFGTCAGLILLAEKVDGDNLQRISTMDIVACRNAYGRQLGSFHTEDCMKGVGTIPMTFIRAPYIKYVGEGVDVLAETGGRIVAACQGRQLVTAFHPELDSDTRVHRLFADIVAGVR